MRVYPHWIVRFGWIVFMAAPAVVFTIGALSEPSEPSRWPPIVLILVILAVGLRAVIGGVEVTGSHYVVRNLFRTRRIPRQQVTGFTARSILWSITWTGDDGKPQFMPLSWFSDDARPLAVRWYNSEAMDALRAGARSATSAS